MIKPVIQEDTTGCGLASVATIAGVSYQEVKKSAGQLDINVHDPHLWTGTKYIRKLLIHYGLSASRTTTPFKSWDSLPRLALLAIKWHKIHDCAFWHWVVFWRSPQGPVVFDPKRELRTNCRTDFGRIKPKWFMAVSSKKSR